MMLFYEEIRNKIKYQSQLDKNTINEKIIKDNPLHIKPNKIQKASTYTNSYNIANIKKSKSFFLSKKLQELKNPNFLNIQQKNVLENKLKYIKKQNTFQKFYNNYPKPEPLPKKIDIRIINNNSNFHTSNINDKNNNYRIRDNKNIYDDKKILFILTNLGLENLFTKFKDNFIIYNDLIFLTKDDFIEMKIPIGPRNRIIHFIEELKKNGNNLDFEELKIFLEKYKKLISGNKPKTRNYKNKNNNEENNKKDEIYKNSYKYINNKKSQNNSFIFSSQYESEKNENASSIDNYNDKNKNKNEIKYSNSFLFNNNNAKNINKINNKKKKIFFPENNFNNFYLSENSKNDKIKEKPNNNNNSNKIHYKIKINQINTNNLSYLLNNKKRLKQKKNRNINYNNTTDNYNYNDKTTFTNNSKFKNVSPITKNNLDISKYKEYNPIKNIKTICIKDKNKTLLRKNTVSTFSNIRNYNDSFHSNISCISKNLLNKLDIINKEVEKYELNYERLKKETKRRNNNVIRILSSNYFEIKNNPKIMKYSNSCNGTKYISYFDNKYLENEKERNLKNELNNYNSKI